MAALLKKDLNVEADVVPGDRGEFTVWVGDALVAQKGADGFPEDSAIVAAVQQKL